MRRRYVVSYDIADDKRRTQVFRLLLGYGDRIQFSVFLADLNSRELIVLRTRLRDLINETADQCIFVDLGRETRPLQNTLEVLGKPYDPPVQCMIV